MRALACSRRDRTSSLRSRSATCSTIVLEVVREPMFLMLVAAGVVYLLLGEPADALMLLGFVFVVMTITIVQARRTEHALEALRDLSSPRALVIRDGQRRRIAGREVVARRPRRPRRRRPRPGRRSAPASAAPCHRRVAADGRVGSRSQGAFR